MALESWLCQSSTTLSNKLPEGIGSHRASCNLVGFIWLCKRAKICSLAKQGEFRTLSQTFRAKSIINNWIYLQSNGKNKNQHVTGLMWEPKTNWESRNAAMDNTRSLTWEKAASLAWTLKYPRTKSLGYSKTQTNMASNGSSRVSVGVLSRWYTSQMVNFSLASHTRPTYSMPETIGAVNALNEKALRIASTTPFPPGLMRTEKLGGLELVQSDCLSLHHPVSNYTAEFTTRVHSDSYSVDGFKNGSDRSISGYWQR